MTDGSAAYGTILRMNGIAIAEVKNFGGPRMGQDVPETTHQESTGAASEFVGALLDGGEVTLDVNFLPQNATQALNTDGSLIYAMYQRSIETFELIWPDISSTTWVFHALVVEFKTDGDSANRLAGTITLKITGKTTRSGAFLATSGGLYKTAIITLDDADDPVWELQGQSLQITHFAVNPTNPQGLQLAIAGDPYDNAVYLRRPMNGDEWQELLTYSQVHAIIGMASEDKDDFRDVAYNPVTDEIIVLFNLKNTGDKFVLRSGNYGGSWSSINLLDGALRYGAGNIAINQQTGEVYISMCIALGGRGSVAYSATGSSFGTVWTSDSGGGWVPLVFIDSLTGIAYAGEYDGDSSPDLVSSEVGWEPIDLGDSFEAGVASLSTIGFTPAGAGWVNPNDSDVIRTIRSNDAGARLYYSDDRWSSGAVRSLAFNNVRAMTGDAQSRLLIARGVGATVGDPHVVFATPDDGATMYEKAGAHPDEADGGGDSVPYNVTPALDGIVLFDAGY